MILTTSLIGCGTLVNLYLKLAEISFVTLGGNSAVTQNRNLNADIFLGCLFIWLVTKRNPRSTHSAHTEPQTHTQAQPTSN